MWIRTCQECGHKQEDRDPRAKDFYMSDAYMDRKCRKCKSMGLDYGKEETTEAHNAPK